MKIEFVLEGSSPSSLKKVFKSAAALSLFEDYRQRISHFAPCQLAILPSQKESGTVHWICHTSAKAKMLSSEQLAEKISKSLDSGVKLCRIMIGGPNGWNEKTLQNLQPDLLWSFGPMTLPHELAILVAAEQIYRGWTILRNLPYHKGHS